MFNGGDLREQIVTDVKLISELFQDNFPVTLFDTEGNFAAI